MATGSWFDLFPVSHTEYLEMGESDHRPMITFMSAEREKPRRFFRYDNRMLHKEGFKDTVRRGWCGMGQSQLVRIPLTQRISRVVNIYLNGRDSIETTLRKGLAP